MADCLPYLMSPKTFTNVCVLFLFFNLKAFQSATCAGTEGTFLAHCTFSAADIYPLSGAHVSLINVVPFILVAS